MKRRAPAILAALVLIALGGCGGDAEEAADDIESPDPPSLTDVTTVEGGATSPYSDDEAEANREGDPVAGEEIYASAGCGGCHTLEAAGSSGTVGPNLDESKPDFQLVVTRVKNGKGTMPAFDEQLSDVEIRDVAAYVVDATK